MSKKHVKAVPGVAPPKPKKKGQLTDIELLALEKQQVYHIPYRRYLTIYNNDIMVLS
jgi:hypothetical protein